MKNKILIILVIAVGALGFTYSEDLTGPGDLPSGFILPFGGTTAPTGYLPCDGAAVSRTTYVDLFNAIGTAYGAGDGSTTFNVPDLRGLFLRGVDGGRGLDPNVVDRFAMQTGGNTGNNVGSMQSFQYQAHAHDNQVRALYGWNIQVNPIPGAGTATVAEKTGAKVSWTTGYTSNSGGLETRPINAYVNYMIKY